MLKAYDTILQGDVIEQLRELPNDYIDCVVTSPPYWGLRDYNIAGQIGHEPHPQEYINKIVEVFREVKRVIKPTGTVFLNLGDTYFGGKGQSARKDHNLEQRQKEGRTLQKREWTVNDGDAPQDLCKADGKWLQPKQKLMIPERTAIAMQDEGWLLRNSIIWHKINHMPESMDDRLTRSYETVFFFTKQKRYYFNLDKIRKPYPKVTIERCQRNYKSNNKVVDGNFDTAKHIHLAEKVIIKHEEATNRIGNFAYSDPLHTKPYNPNGANPGDVWSLTLESFKGAHFATFPTKLVKLCLQCGCPDNGLMLDLFSGSGTALMVARRMALHYIGIDLNPKYIEMAKQRLIKNKVIHLQQGQTELALNHSKPIC